MAKTTFINVLSGLTKLLIFPYFYFGTFLFAFVTINYASDSFSKNYGEAIEGIALGMVLVAPFLLLFLIPLTLLILYKTRMLHCLKYDWFLTGWGIAAAAVGVLLLLSLELLSDVLW